MDCILFIRAESNADSFRTPSISLLQLGHKFYVLIKAVITFKCRTMDLSKDNDCMFQENILFIFSVASLEFEYTFNTRGYEALGYIMDWLTFWLTYY